MSSFNRQIWADNLKGFLILVVVLGHALQLSLGDDCFDNHLLNIICSFQMPVFFAVSGYFAFPPRNRTIGKSIIRRTQQLLIPFFIWSLIQFVLDGEYTLVKLVGIVLFPDGYFWFLWALFFIFLLFTFSEALSEKLKINISVVVISMCLFLAGIMVVFEIRYFGFQFIAYYFLFYVIGYFFHKFDFILKLGSKIWWWCVWALWLVLAWNWRIDSAPTFLSFLPLPSSLILYIYKFIVGLIATWLAMSLFLTRERTSDPSTISKMGELSLGIYVFHRLTMNYLLAGLLMIISSVHTSVIIVFLFILSVLISWIVVLALSNNRYTRQYLLGKL